jgi:HPt (histidine-containing phosphotransfer) domain-containing protein
MEDTDHSDVIDWDEAMEQCGGDEDFLHELLGDLQEELNTQIRKIEVAIVSARKKLLFPFLISVVGPSAAHTVFESPTFTSGLSNVFALCSRYCSGSRLTFEY